MREKELFGEIAKLKAEGGNRADMEKLRGPFENEDAFMRSFCSGCGLMSEIYEAEARELAKKTEAILPSDSRNYYFETGKCGYCDSKDESIKLLPIEARDQG